MTATASEPVSARTFWADLPRPGRWLLATTTASTIGRGMTLPFTVIYLHEVRGVSLAVSGVLMGVIALVALIVTGPVGVLTDRFGARRMLLWGNTCQSVGALLIGFGTTVPVLGLGLALLGASFGIGWPAFNALISAVVSGAVRTQFFGINFALLNLGIGIGGVLGGLLADVTRAWTFTVLFLVDALCGLIPIGLLLGPLRHVHGRAQVPADADEGHPSSYLRIIRQPAMAWMTTLTFVGSLVGYGQMEAGFPAFARQVSEVSTRTVGFAFAINTVVIVGTQFLVLRWIVGRRRTRVFLVLIGLWAGAWALLWVTAAVPGTLLAAILVCAFHVLFGVGETMLNPTLPAIVNDLAPAHLRGRYNAASALAFQLGAIAAPVSAGVLRGRGWACRGNRLLLGGLALMVLLALALERRITPVVNGVEPVEPISR